MRKSVVILLSVLPLCAAEPLSFEAAWQTYLGHNQGLKAAEVTVAEQVEKKKGAESMVYMPRVDLHGSYTRLSRPVQLDISPVTDALNAIGAALPVPLPPLGDTLDLSEQDVFLANLSVFWPLYTGGKVSSLVEIREAGIDAARARKALEEQKGFLLLVKLYYGERMAAIAYRTRKTAEEAYALHLEHAEKLRAEGQIAEVERLSVKVRYDRAVIETEKARRQHETTLESLRRLLGKTQILPDSPFFVCRNFGSKQRYLKQVLQTAPVHLAEALTRQSASAVKIARGDYLPSLFAFGNYTLYKDDSILSESVPQWFAGVGVNINLLSADGRGGKLEAAKLLERKARLKRKQLEEDLKMLVDKTYAEAVTALETYDGYDSTIALAEENARLRRLAFDEGLATALEVIDAQSRLDGAKTLRLKAAYDFIVALARLTVLTGEKERFMQMAENGEEVR